MCMHATGKVAAGEEGRDAAVRMCARARVGLSSVTLRVYVGVCARMYISIQGVF